MLGLFGLFGIGIGLANNARIHNQKYYGTDRDIFKDNPQVQENRKAVDDIIARQKAEYIKKHGHCW